MRRSFEAGLKKSLPPSLLKNNALMSKFSVKLWESEPTAYAVTALKEYGFHPEENETYYYAVFDCGAEKTGFDFGLIQESENDRYDYTIRHFGESFDRILGGENLLRLLAFNVFKRNRDVLLNFKGDGDRATKITFTWAVEKDDFAGSDELISDSQEAYMNMYALMEKLRPFWEDPDSDVVKEIINCGYVELDLLDESGSLNRGVHLNITADFENDVDFWLFKLLDQRIEVGIKNFFIAMQFAFENMENVEENQIQSLDKLKEISIFLAGNSSRSKRINTIFERYAGKEKLALPLLGLVDKNVDLSFKLYPALGTDAAFELLTELHEEDPEYVQMPSKGSPEDPTAKTGVAYGLLHCREGGLYHIIHLASPEKNLSFQFYVGRNKKNRFKVVIDRNSELGKWYDFIDAGGNFDIIYTDIPEAALGNIPVQKAKCIPIHLPNPDHDARIFIRAVQPRSIEYTIAKNIADLESEKHNEEVVLIHLD